MALSVATSFAIDASLLYGRPCGGHVGEHEREALVIDDLRAEGLPIPGVSHRCVQGTLGQAGRHCGDAETSGVESRQRDPQPLALLAQPALYGHPDVVEAHRGGDRARETHLALGCVGGEAVGISGHQEAGDAMPVVAGPGHHRVEVGVAAVGGPGLGAGDDVLLALSPGPSGHRGRVGTGMRLAQAVGAQQLAAEQVRQEPLPLLLGAAGEQPEAGEGVYRDADADAGPHRGDLLEHLEVNLVGLTSPAVLLRVGQT